MTLTDDQLKEQHALIERAKCDPEAFGELFEAHYSMILNYVIRRTGDVATAQDITSTVFIKALDGLSRFRWQGVPFSAWLYRIAGNELRMYYRQNRRLISLEDLQNEGLECISDTNLQEELEDAQDAVNRALRYQEVKVAISTMPQKYQEVLALRYGEHKKISEIAIILGKREGTVKSLLSRATIRLRRALPTNNAQPFEGTGIMLSEGRTNNNKSQERI